MFVVLNILYFSSVEEDRVRDRQQKSIKVRLQKKEREGWKTEDGWELRNKVLNENKGEFLRRSETSIRHVRTPISYQDRDLSQSGSWMVFILGSVS